MSSSNTGSTTNPPKVKVVVGPQFPWRVSKIPKDPSHIERLPHELQTEIVSYLFPSNDQVYPTTLSSNSYGISQTNRQFFLVCQEYFQQTKFETLAFRSIEDLRSYVKRSRGLLVPRRCGPDRRNVTKVCIDITFERNGDDGVVAGADQTPVIAGFLQEFPGLKAIELRLDDVADNYNFVTDIAWVWDFGTKIEWPEKLESIRFRNLPLERATQNEAVPSPPYLIRRMALLEMRMINFSIKQELHCQRLKRHERKMDDQIALLRDSMRSTVGSASL